MKRYSLEHSEGHLIFLPEDEEGSLVFYEDVVALQEEIDHLNAYTDHLVQFSRLPCLPKDLENLRESNEILASENNYLKGQIEFYKNEFANCVEVASIFQTGGKYAKRANLSLGSCTIIDGIKWADGEIERLDARIKVLLEDIEPSTRLDN